MTVDIYIGNVTYAKLDIILIFMELASKFTIIN